MMPQTSMWEISPISNASNELDKLFNSFFDDPLYSVPSKVSKALVSKDWPHADVYEDEGGNFHAEIAAAGYDEDEISATYENGQIRICLEKNESAEDHNKKKVWIQKGIKYRESAEQDIFLDPARYDPTTLDINLKNGLISVTAKRAEAAKKRALSINGKVPKIEDDDSSDGDEDTSKE